MIDDKFFQKHHRVILWFANTKLGKLYLTSGWSKSERKLKFNWIKAEKFYKFTPSSAVVEQEHFHTCRKCIRNPDPEIQKACKHKRKILAVRNRGVFYTNNHFAKKVSFVLFWLPYWRGFLGSREVILRPAYAFPLFIFLNYLSLKILGTPFLFGTVSTFNSATGANDPVDGRVENSNAVWSTMRNAATGEGAATSSATQYFGVGQSAGAGPYFAQRMFMLFNTGDTITAGSTINATADTKLSWFKTASAVLNSDNDGEDFITVGQCSPASDSTLATADFDQITPIPVTATVAHTEGIDSGTRLDFGSITVSTTHAQTLNATGRGWIADADDTKPDGAISAGRTRLVLLEGHDVLDSSFVGGAGTQNQIEIALADNGSNKPELSVDWTAPPPPPAPFTGDDFFQILGVGT